MNTITPFLWFDDNVENAVELYTAVFPAARVTNVAHYGEAGPGTPGSILTATIEIDGQEIILLNGGPGHPFTEAISLSVRADTQDEIDSLWEQLTANGGQPGQCGWLTDPFGLSWQIVPPILGELMSDPDPEKAGRTMQAMLQMTKLDIAGLQRAHDGA
ncbi:VOC family protein [Glaciihabitans sp. dw_435]|uniref:VOC family protein n=1 Tax=Glaciihabitans sp. dw_435 TaxID=2720081 RepID=UPI001BD6C093|nr:VOC family protein [Glaciihabitans sp. dw_435]